MNLELKRRSLDVLKGVLIASIPALITAYYGYKSTKVESESGYKTLVAAVEKLQRTAERQNRHTARLEGTIQILGGFHGVKLQPPAPEPEAAAAADKPMDLALHTPLMSYGPPTAPVVASSAPPKKPLKLLSAMVVDNPPAPPEKFAPLPKSLDEAVQQQAF